MKVVVNLNGVIKGANKATVSVFDHGFLYGDSIFETIIAYNGKPLCLKEHLARLFRSAKSVYMKPIWSTEKYEREIKRTLAHFDKKNLQHIIRIILTRGVGPIGYNPKLCPKPTNIILVQEFSGQPQKFFSQGVPIWLVNRKRNSRDALNPAIKTGNLLNNILAHIEAQKSGGFEAIMLNQAGYITEGTTCNVFVVKNNVIKTPPLEAGILAGITRKLVFKLARKARIKIKEVNLRPQDLFTSDECFLTSTLKEIMPVTHCNKKRISNGKVGPMTQRLIHLYRGYVRKVLFLH
ncbi:MAG TPA: aminotransferase class IV [Bdellovibrionota bacterium]|nr:aminotransferase class IV [Bdellovibrionota bacterium]